LTRSIVTAYRSLETAGVAYTPLEYDWRWNERHYGALQGLSKERTAVRLGQEKVMKWRRSYDACPPLMTPEHPHYDTINNDPRYRHLDPPLGESLEDCQVRVVEAWKDFCKDIATAEDDESESEYSLLVAHANTLRALVMHLDDIGVNEIEGLNIPTAIPFYYDIDKTTGQVVSSHVDSNDVIAAGKFRGIYISDERKKRSFLERRRAANDPWMWALHDHQVKASMLEGNTGVDPNGEATTTEENDLEALKDEARKNTELFAPGSGWHG
jgi:2,3-bisphosphoglycerate-dependent phosphoglycerate mutase